VIIPARGNSSGSNRDAALTLLGHPVGYSCTVVHLTNFVHNTGVEQDPLSGGCLTSVNMGCNTYISDAFQGKSRATGYSGVGR
jgi:hypothetical protein